MRIGGWSPRRFLAIVVASFRAGSPGAGAALFVAYALGKV